MEPVFVTLLHCVLKKEFFYRIIRLYGKKKNQHVDMDTAIQYFEGSQLIMMLCVMYLGLARNVSDWSFKSPDVSPTWYFCFIWCKKQPLPTS